MRQTTSSLRMLTGLALLAACSGGGSGGGDVVVAVPSGALVAQLETSLPPLDEFLLRGTVPVPPGTFPRSDGRSPLTVLDYDGTPLETQTNLVSRYPDEGDGADVVEVLARVRRDPAFAPQVYARYDVSFAPGAPVPDPESPSVEDLSTTSALPAAVQALLADPLALEITAYDCFGNAYTSHPLDGTGSMRLERHGLLQTELRVYQTLLPVTPDPGPTGTLPHLFGVHVYISTFAGEERVGLDLRFHNGHSGLDAIDPVDDALDEIYFDRIDLVVPSNWYAEQAFEDPFFGASSTSGGRRTQPLVAPTGDGTLHVMRWQAQTQRRVMLSTAGRRVEARQYVQRGAGQAFARRGTDPERGVPLWSWWNEDTARYWPQNYPLPILDHLDLGSLRQSERLEHERFEDYLVAGASNAKQYPVPDGPLGWAHPWGVPYGGMTGGDEIYLYDGLVTAHAANPLGIQAYRGLLRMSTDRMWTAFYDADGSPSSVEDWLVGSSYVPFAHFVHPSLSGNDPVGLWRAPRFQIQHVEANALQPAYAGTLDSYQAIDYQHLIRYTRSAKVLAWLANDSLAKDELMLQAESFRLAYHPYMNSGGGGVQGSGMRADMDFIAAVPGSGFTFGRGEAWGSDAVLASYATAPLAWRGKVRPWFEELARVVSDGQATCSGFIQANVTPKNLGGQFRTRQQIEQSITENMLIGLDRTVFKGIDPGYSALVRDVLVRSLRGFTSDMVWGPFGNVPPSYSAVGPLDTSLPVWCSFAEMPKNPISWSTSGNTYLDWCSFTWGYELTGDPDFLDKARLQMGALNLDELMVWLETDGTENIENRAALLALMQRLYGQS